MRWSKGKSKALCNRDKSMFQILNLKIVIVMLTLLPFLGISPSTVWGVDTTHIPTGATWKYKDDGSNQGTAWQDPAFDDTTWSSGPAELGYNDGDEATIVSFGPDPNNKYITTYFRHSFTVADASIFIGLTLNIERDDGAVFYLNGTEVSRTNMPVGTITYTTLASSAVEDAPDTFYVFCVDPSLLVDGTNVLTVEIHQISSASSDISFDLELIGHSSAPAATNLTRGPYLQMGTPSSIVVKWGTDSCSDSRVSYGNNSGALINFVDDTTLTIDHEIEITGLPDPDTKYFYSIGTITGIPLAGGDNNHFFVTSLSAGANQSTRIWVIGDSGTANADAEAVRDAYLSFTGITPTDVWLMLGDNAYPIGTDDQYQAAVFDMYPTLLRNTVLWPTLGNHDAEPSGVSLSTGSGPYFDMFTLPTLAEAGGLASGTEAYYSFDYGSIHFISLNSTGSDRSPGSVMLTWLENDLSATNMNWIIAYWHHPPYSHGSHNSDTACSTEPDCRLVDMRENVLPILEDYGVDLVLTGHSHSYERSYLIDQVYGFGSSPDFQTPDFPTLLSLGRILDSGDGHLDGDGAYTKPTLGQGPNEGTIYSVVGSSGMTGSGSLNHPVMFIAFNVLGSMVIDVNGSQLDATFIDSTGVTQDYFTIVKEGPICDIQMSQTTYTAGDTVTVQVLRFANPGADPVPMEWKIWLGNPVDKPVSQLNEGADGSFIFPAGLDRDFGPVTLFPAAGMPLGSYEFSCRMLDPVTGKLLTEDFNPFTIE